LRESTRAARSAALVAGFWLTAWLPVVAALLAVLVVLALLPGSSAVRVGAPLCIAVGGPLWYAAVRALRIRHPGPAGVAVTRADAPVLWSVIDAAAATAGVAPPHAASVVAGATASLVERSRMAGLAGGRRDLYLGLPLLQAWDSARLRAVIAHEMAHGSPRLGRLAPVAFRGRLAIGRIVPRIPRRSPAGPLLRAYARWYRRLDAPFCRAQELAADRIAAEFAGVRAAVATLRDGPALEAMQRLFHAEYVSPGWAAGYVPDDVFGGFLRVLAARADEMTVLRAREPEPPAEWDTHPARADRLAALTAFTPGALLTAPAADSLAADPKDPARHGDLAAPGAGERAVAARATGSQGGSAAGSASAPEGDSAAERALAKEGGSAAGPALAREGGSAAGPALAGEGGAVGGPALGTEGGSAAGPGWGTAEGSHGGPAIAAEHGPRARSAGSSGLEDEELVPDLPGLGHALQAVAFPPGARTVVGWDEFFGVARRAEMEREADAALRSIGRAVGRPVSGPADVLDLVADGRLHKAAEALFGDLPPAETAGHIAELITLLLALAALRSGVARWRHSWTGTAELVAVDGSYLDLGEPAALASDPATVDVARARLAELGIDLAGAPDTAARVPVLGGVVNVVVDGARTDLLVVETGLFLVPGLPRPRNGEAKRRLARLAATGVQSDGSLATDGDGAAGVASRFVPFVDVTAAVAPTRSRRRTWEVTLQDGAALTIRTALDSDELPGGWAALDDAVDFLSRTRRPAPAR
jgi:Zn-dependent protease with chaperone function